MEEGHRCGPHSRGCEAPPQPPLGLCPQWKVLEAKVCPHSLSGKAAFQLWSSLFSAAENITCLRYSTCPFYYRELHHALNSPAKEGEGLLP